MASERERAREIKEAQAKITEGDQETGQRMFDKDKQPDRVQAER
jgi:hypothetical protein